MLPRCVIGLVIVALAGLPLQPAYAQPRLEAAPIDAQSLQTRYPHAQLIEVSAADYPALAQSLRQAGYLPQALPPAVQLAANEQPSTSPAPAPAPALPAPEQAPPPAASDRRAGDCNDASTQQTSSEGRIGVDVNIGNGGHRGGHGGGHGSGNEAVVIFVIVGAVVLVVWTFYAIKYLADRARGVEGCGERWSEWALAHTSINSYRPQYANFTGLRYLGGISQDGFGFGISAEIGQSEVLLAEASALRLQGLYWLLGPLLRWRLSPGTNPSYFQMEFLAGSTENQEVGVIAVAKLGFNFGLSDRLRLGISYGAMNLNLHEQGIILDRSQYYTLWGLDMGYRF